MSPRAIECGLVSAEWSGNPGRVLRLRLLAWVAGTDETALGLLTTDEARALAGALLELADRADRAATPG